MSESLLCKMPQMDEYEVDQLLKTMESRTNLPESVRGELEYLRWQIGARKQQQQWLERLGEQSYDFIDYNLTNNKNNAKNALWLKIGFALYGYPEVDDVYNKEQDECISKLCIKIQEISRQFKNNGIYFSVIFIPCFVEAVTGILSKRNPPTEYVDVLFIVGKNPYSKEARYVDSHLRVYNSWECFKETNKFPKCSYALPIGGKYQTGQDGRVLLSFEKSPATFIKNVIMNALDIGSLGLGLGGAAVGLTGIFIPVAYPIMIGSYIAGAASGFYSFGRSVNTLRDRHSHQQSIHVLRDKEARSAWIDLVLSGATVGFSIGSIYSATASATAKTMQAADTAASSVAKAGGEAAVSAASSGGEAVSSVSGAASKAGKAGRAAKAAGRAAKSAANVSNAGDVASKSARAATSGKAAASATKAATNLGKAGEVAAKSTKVVTTGKAAANASKAATNLSKAGGAAAKGARVATSGKAAANASKAAANLSKAGGAAAKGAGVATSGKAAANASKVAASIGKAGEATARGAGVATSAKAAVNASKAAANLGKAGDAAAKGAKMATSGKTAANISKSAKAAVKLGKAGGAAAKNASIATSGAAGSANKISKAAGKIMSQVVNNSGVSDDAIKILNDARSVAAATQETTNVMNGILRAEVITGTTTVNVPSITPNILTNISNFCSQHVFQVCAVTGVYVLSPIALEAIHIVYDFIFDNNSAVKNISPKNKEMLQQTFNLIQKYYSGTLLPSDILKFVSHALFFCNTLIDDYKAYITKFLQALKQVIEQNIQSVVHIIKKPIKEPAVFLREPDQTDKLISNMMLELSQENINWPKVEISASDTDVIVPELPHLHSTDSEHNKLSHDADDTDCSITDNDDSDEWETTDEEVTFE